VELASQDIVDKLLFRLVVHPSSLVLENEIVIPSTLDGKASGGRCPSVGSRRRGHLTQSGLKVQKRVTGGDLGLPVYAVGLRSLLLLRKINATRRNLSQPEQRFSPVAGRLTCRAFSSARSCLILFNSAINAAVSSSSSSESSSLIRANDPGQLTNPSIKQSDSSSPVVIVVVILIIIIPCCSRAVALHILILSICSPLLTLLLLRLIRILVIALVIRIELSSFL
jgi:hypothetical protein